MADSRPDTSSFIRINRSSMERIPPYFILHTWMLDDRGPSTATWGRPETPPQLNPGLGRSRTSAETAPRRVRRYTPIWLNQRLGRQSARWRWGKDPRVRKGLAGRIRGDRLDSNRTSRRVPATGSRPLEN